MILIEKCDKYGIRGVAKEWLISYLNGRKQYVSYNGMKSNKETISYGVPQGSILGPLLFLIYINDLTAVSKEYRPILFADDTNIFFVYKNKQTQQTYIRKELEKIQTWMNCNELSFNLNKTQYMIYYPTNKHEPDLDLTINSVQIERVYEIKFLGVKCDPQLTWKPHIDHIGQKMLKSVGIILKTRKKCILR